MPSLARTFLLGSVVGWLVLLIEGAGVVLLYVVAWPYLAIRASVRGLQTVIDARVIRQGTVRCANPRCGRMNSLVGLATCRRCGFTEYGSLLACGNCGDAESMTTIFCRSCRGPIQIFHN